MRFSLVIPAYNEERYLSRLLDSVDAARKCYVGGEDAIEVIVADNSSTDATAELARGRGCSVVRVEKRVIGAVRNGGAAAARGDIVCFVDADMRISAETFNVVDATITNARIVGGATGIRPERWSLGFAATYALLIPMVVVMKMDTGVVFCRRNDFETIGGYREDLLFAEDVDFLFRLRALGKKKKQKLTRATKAKAIASVRKFDQHGQWHYFTSVIPMAAKIFFRKDAAKDFAERYWYKPDR